VERTDASGMNGRCSGFTPPKPVFAGECENANIYQEILRQHVVSEAEGCSLIENMSFCGFSAGLRRPNDLAAVGGILVFGGLAAIIAKLEPA
jgi:hypothetical protein